jgi:hypothetical protein
MEHNKHKVGDLLLSLDGCLGYIIEWASATTYWVEWIVPDGEQYQCLSAEFIGQLKKDLEKKCQNTK